MSYTPNTWQDGDIITAAKLNNIEGGIENANTPFVVTLTPTTQDFSGTMDKTVAEINAAYQLGRRIVFRLITSAATMIEIECVVVAHGSGFAYPSFNLHIVTDQPFNALVYAWTGLTNDGDKNTYGTQIYTLTPMGG